MKKDLDYKRDVKIHRNNLDKDMIEQPQFYQDYGILSAEAEIAFEIAKHDYETTKGKVAKRIRQFPEKYGLKDVKLTESVVDNEAEQNIKVKKYYDKYIKAMSAHKTLTRVEKSFQHRKNMLESLSYNSNRIYNAEPNNTRSNLREYRRELNEGLSGRRLKRRKEHG